MPRKRKVLLTEFVIQVYSDKVVFNGFDRFLWWSLTRKPTDGFLPYAHKIKGFGVCTESGKKPLK